MQFIGIRGEIFSILKAPPAFSLIEHDEGSHILHILDGVLCFDPAGHIKRVCSYESFKQDPLYQKTKITDFPGHFIVPGFIDTHIHFPQVDSIACYGKQLLGWLNQFIFKQEARYADATYAAAQAQRFVTLLKAAGTTTSCIFSSSHKQATDILFRELDSQGMRAIAGKVSMDLLAPESLLTQAVMDIQDNLELIEKWHGKDDRLFYALTPRFALSCSPTLMTELGRLKQRFPDLYIQTHLAESKQEVAEVATLFPESASYTHVYDQHHLLHDRTILAHGIHLDDRELDLIASRNATISHCPTSNLFLGSGIIDLPRCQQHQVNVSLGTDVGAGTSFSLWETMASAYGLQHLEGRTPSPEWLFYSATLGAAQALKLDHAIGSFEEGKQADFQVLSPHESGLLKRRFQESSHWRDKIFAFMHMYESTAQKQTWVQGQLVYKQTR